MDTFDYFVFYSKLAALTATCVAVFYEHFGWGTLTGIPLLAGIATVALWLIDVIDTWRQGTETNRIVDQLKGLRST